MQIMFRSLPKLDHLFSCPYSTDSPNVARNRLVMWRFCANTHEQTDNDGSLKTTRAVSCAEVIVKPASVVLGCHVEFNVLSTCENVMYTYRMKAVRGRVA